MERGRRYQPLETALRSLQKLLVQLQEPLQLLALPQELALLQLVQLLELVLRKLRHLLRHG